MKTTQKSISHHQLGFLTTLLSHGSNYTSVLDSALPLSLVAFSILSYLFSFIIHRISHQPAYKPLTDQDDAERTIISSLPFYEDTIKQLDYPAVKRRISRSEIAVFVFSTMQVVLWAVLTVLRVRGGHKDHNNEGWQKLVGSAGALIAWVCMFVGR